MTDSIVRDHHSGRSCHLRSVLCPLFLLCFMVLLSAYAVSDDYTSASDDGIFEDNGIRYQISTTESTAVSVISKDIGYSGNLTIPSTVDYSSVTYNVTAISAYAFNYCYGLTSVTLPVSVVTINECGFYMCSGLETLDLGSSKITEIKDMAFYGCSSLCDITLPADLISIGTDAFTGCSSLSELYIPKNVETIDSTAFRSCSGLVSFSVSADNSVFSSVDGVICDKEGLMIMHYPAGRTDTEYTVGSKIHTIDDCAFIDAVSLRTVTVGNDVRTIGSRAFSGCTGLLSVNIPDEVISVGENAFEGCSNLYDVTIGSNIRTIEYGTFSECIGLCAITIPKNITSIGDRAFYGCFHLVEICNDSSLTFTAGSTDNGYIALYAENIYSSSSGESILTRGDYDDYTITYLDKDTVIEVISINAYSGEITLPEFEKNAYIKMTAFMNNADLVSVIIPDCYTSLGASSFFGCPNLTDIVIGNGVTAIGAYAFYGCTKLSTVNIGRAVESIGGYAFSGCTHLTSIVYSPENCTMIGKCIFDNAGISGDGVSLIFTDSVRTIPERLFYETDSNNIRTIDISDNVETVGDYSMYDCKNIREIYIGKNVTSIGKYTFFSSIFYDQDTVTKLDQTCKNLTGFRFTGDSSLELIRENTYTISYLNENGKLYDTLSKPIYTVITSLDCTIKKESTEQYDYVQTGWMYSETMAKVTYPFVLENDISLKPIYSGELRYYTITFYDYDKSIIKSEYKPYGDPIDIPVPEREQTEQQVFAFSKWTNLLGNQIYIPSVVGSDLSAYATYDASPRLDGTVNVYYLFGACAAIIALTVAVLLVRKPE